MSTVFKTPLNQVSTTLGSAYTSGGSSFVVANGTGSLFGSPSSSAPVRVTVISAATYLTDSEILGIYYITSRSGDTLTISPTGAKEGTTDRNYAVGDFIEVRLTAATISDIHTAVNNLEGNTSGITMGGSPPTITTSATSLVLKETGDTYGTISVALENRSGINGIMITNEGIGLADFALVANNGKQVNFRHETRTSPVNYVFGTGNGNSSYSGEFQVVSQPMSSNHIHYPFVAGDQVVVFYPTNQANWADYTISPKVGVLNYNPQSVFHVSAGHTGDVVSIFQGVASQTGDLTQWQNSSATVLARVESSGNFKTSGGIGVNGSSVPAKASSPGTATGTDATVINAIVTILRNIGFCS